MAVDELQLQKIVSEVLKKMGENTGSNKQMGIFDDMETAVMAAKESQKSNEKATNGHQRKHN